MVVIAVGRTLVSAQNLVEEEYKSVIVHVQSQLLRTEERAAKELIVKLELVMTTSVQVNPFNAFINKLKKCLKKSFFFQLQG